MGTVKAYALLIVIALIVGAIGTGAWIIDGIIDENKVLQGNVKTLEAAKATQDAAIKGLSEANAKNVERVEAMQKGLNGLQAAYQQSQQDVSDLRKRYSRIVIQRGKDGNVLPSSNDALNSGVNDLNRMLSEAARNKRRADPNRASPQN